MPVEKNSCVLDLMRKHFHLVSRNISMELFAESMGSGKEDAGYQGNACMQVHLLLETADFYLKSGKWEKRRRTVSMRYEDPVNLRWCIRNIK